MLPAQDGDCFLVEAMGTRILIDGGRTATGQAALPTLLRTLPPRDGPLLDLLVLTHVDADHIEGLLPFLGDATATVGEIWFNGFAQIAAAAGMQDILPARGPAAATAAEPVLSPTQGLTLARLIDERGLDWNTRFTRGPISTRPDAPLPAIDLAPDVRIVILGPPEAKLAAFLPAWREALRTFATEPEPTLRGRIRPTPTPQNIRTIASLMDESDQAKANGTSIAFVVECRGRTALFGADAHPDDLAHALVRYRGGPEGRVPFDLIKVPHHGSAKNNTSPLIDIVSSPLWLVSSDGSRHQHPDPEAIARIVLAPDREKTIAFNYRTAFNEGWDEDGIKNAFGYITRYGSISDPLAFDLL
ncbi:MBL fold metallo-hydrolase [Methylobacterium sp. Leaf456]|uniref:ComEC/Rec2 family competence protein n=1 Tax=Methylobacterium sp. Leaf456 TaxID=1736382 RepID=UPI000AF8F698|nr:MBL fold metallo-hydrolase [Methylobacterium sp. Leaf456]